MGRNRRRFIRAAQCNRANNFRRVLAPSRPYKHRPNGAALNSRCNAASGPPLISSSHYLFSSYFQIKRSMPSARLTGADAPAISYFLSLNRHHYRCSSRERARKKRRASKSERAGNCRCNASLVTDDLFVLVGWSRGSSDRDLREYFRSLRLQLAFPPFSCLACRYWEQSRAQIDAQVCTSQRGSSWF